MHSTPIQQILHAHNITTKQICVHKDRSSDICTCLSAFLLCFWEEEMSLLLDTEGEEQRDCGEDGCDCRFAGPKKLQECCCQLVQVGRHTHKHTRTYFFFLSPSFSLRVN